jgi:hypothetical protein
MYDAQGKPMLDAGGSTNDSDGLRLSDKAIWRRRSRRRNLAPNYEFTLKEGQRGELAANEYG